MMARRILLQLLLLAVAGTTLGLTLAFASMPQNSNSEQRHLLLLRVTDDAGAAVAGATILRGNRAAGATNARGEFSLVIQEAAREVVELRVDCPSGYVENNGLLRIAPQSASGAAAPLLPEERRLICSEKQLNAVLLVRTVGAEALPLVVNGKRAAMTDAAAETRLAYRVRPRSKLEVRLDTSAQPRLLPQNPTRTFTIVEDAVVVFEQSFEMSPRSRMRSSPQGTQNHAPYRLN